MNTHLLKELGKENKIFYEKQLEELLDSSLLYLSNISPSQWAEQNIILTSEVSAFPGRFSYDKTPYCREIIDCLSPNHPAKVIACKKGAQIGFSTGVIYPGQGWIISQNPGNIMFLTGHAELSEEAMGRVDQMIDSAGLRPLIRPNVIRKKNMRTGDTNKSKEFPGGSMVSGSATNHKLLAQRSIQFSFNDDYEKAKSSSKQSGSIFELILQRHAAYDSKMKAYFISTPELADGSNIEDVYLMGDQRRYHVPCPVCKEYIILLWSVDIDSKEKAGIYWKTDQKGRLIQSSVGYICQKCSNFFTDETKFEMNLAGRWEPTAEPKDEGYYSYKISSLYAPPGMFGWRHYVNQYIDAYPENQPIRIAKAKTFTNLVLGETFKDEGQEINANKLQKNTRPYQILTIPESLSIKDGNGKIVLLTCACDLNGKVEDARLDYLITAWSETGASYSISHGSIGTFIPMENAMKYKIDRIRSTYEHNRPNSVWPEFDKIRNMDFFTDTDRRMIIAITGVDTGQYTNYAYEYVDTRQNIVCLKGDSEKFLKINANIRTFNVGKERPNLYLVMGNKVKDEVAEMINLRWDENNDEQQPHWFMNFPIPSSGLYMYENFYEHFAAEHRVEEKGADGQITGMRWVKINAMRQNHLWDCFIYSKVLLDIIVFDLAKKLKRSNFTWKEYVDIAVGRIIL